MHNGARAPRLPVQCEGSASVDNISVRLATQLPSCEDDEALISRSEEVADSKRCGIVPAQMPHQITVFAPPK